MQKACNGDSHIVKLLGSLCVSARGIQDLLDSFLRWAIAGIAQSREQSFLAKFFA